MSSYSPWFHKQEKKKKEKKQTQQGSVNAQEKKFNLTARRSQKKSLEIKVQIKFKTCKGEGNKNLSIKHTEETFLLFLIENVNLFKKQTRGPNKLAGNIGFPKKFMQVHTDSWGRDT